MPTKQKEFIVIPACIRENTLSMNIQEILIKCTRERNT